MIETLKNAFANKDIRRKILLTLLLLAVFRIGCYIPVPGLANRLLTDAVTTNDFLGLMSAAHAFNHGFSRMARSMRWGYYICRGIVEAALAFMLLYAPNDAEHIYFHIIVFGIQLIVSAFNTFPPVKEYLSRAK